MASEVRIDKWLWAMRIFKTRTVATDACRKGRVTVGNDTNPVKPSRTVGPGDIIHVRKPPVTFTFRVKAVTQNRLGAKLVPDYMENLTPQSQYDLLEVVKISGFIDRRKGLGRPTKREGRELAQFTDNMSDDGWDFDFDFDDDADDDFRNDSGAED
ncbi:MAG: RNA-binding S4 domain-containing protein [Muribaculaceae bacterium]|nr:RNA-binding S4 domain-containing protein [Muribaculaceae bacterium]